MEGMGGVRDSDEFSERGEVVEEFDRPLRFSKSVCAENKTRLLLPVIVEPRGEIGEFSKFTMLVIDELGDRWLFPRGDLGAGESLPVVTNPQTSSSSSVRTPLEVLRFSAAKKSFLDCFVSFSVLEESGRSSLLVPLVEVLSELPNFLKRAPAAAAEIFSDFLFTPVSFVCKLGSTKLFAVDVTVPVNGVDVTVPDVFDIQPPEE